MKRVGLRTVVVLALLFVFLAGTLSLIRTFGTSRLERYKRELRAKGEKLLVAELAPGPVISNAMLPRLAQANQHLPSSPYAYSAFSIMQGTNGTAPVAWLCPTNDWQKWQTALNEGVRYLSEIRAAVKLKPYDYGWNYEDYESISGTPLIEVRKAAQWLGSAVIIELNRDRRSDALENLLALIDLTQSHEQEGSFTFQMIRIALADFALRVTWEAMQGQLWSDDELRRIQKAWAQVALGKPVQFSLRMERAIALSYFEMARRGKTNATDLIKLSTPPDVPDVYTPLWRLALSAKDELLFLQMMQAFIDALGDAIEASSGQELERRVLAVNLPTGQLASYRFPMSYAVTPNILRALKNWVRTETLRQMALAAIALERHRLRHGRYPAKLDELVPEILSSVPIDFGDSKPLRYQIEGEQYRLWSVWENTRWPRAE